MSEEALAKLAEEEGWEGLGGKGKTYYQIGFCSKVSEGERNEERRVFVVLIYIYFFFAKKKKKNRVASILLNLLYLSLGFMRKMKN